MVQVAIDAGPLFGPRTGIGNAVAWTIDALNASADESGVRLSPYVTSARARVTSPQRKLPLPAALAHRLWARTSMPHMDRWLGHPDVVHGTNYVVPPTSAPRLVSVYDCWFLDHPDDAHPDVARAAQVLRRSVGEGAVVVTSSEATTDRARELLDTERVHTVHLGPPPVSRAPRTTPTSLAGLDNDDDALIVAIGTLERRKNIPLLVRAFGELAGEHPTVRLAIAGRDGDDSPAIGREINALTAHARRRVALLGSVDDDAKQWLLRRATALAYPSLDEGFGFPILEAQSAGTAVVASAAGSIPEVAGSGALLSVPTDATALATNLFGVVTSETRRQRLVDAGHQNVARFSWVSTAAALSELYHELANRT